MKCKCGFEIEKLVAYKHGCLKCGDKSLVNKLKVLDMTQSNCPEKAHICYKGKCQGLKAWAVELGMNYNTLNGRKWRGLPVEEILKTKHE